MSSTEELCSDPENLQVENVEKQLTSPRIDCVSGGLIELAWAFAAQVGVVCAYQGMRYHTAPLIPETQKSKIGCRIALPGFRKVYEAFF